MTGNAITCLNFSLNVGKAGHAKALPSAGVEVNCSSLFLNVSLSFRIIFNIVMPLDVRH